MSSERAAVAITGLGKSYRLHHQRGAAGQYLKLSDAITERVASMFRYGSAARPQSEETFWALRDLNLEVRRGERVGIIGRNGAGKSTLLKLISRITRPTTGRIEISGTVSSLLEVGTGFHPELTGRENIFLNGAVLGMRREQIEERFDEIVEFAEVSRFLDTPVKRYSSGMYMRLAFAVAAHLEPDILIVDEVLAVGDAAFQKKCLGKMREVGSHGRTVLFVSHNMGAIAEFCDRVIMLERGKVLWDGPTREVLARYGGEWLENESGTFDVSHVPSDPRCRVSQVRFEQQSGATSGTFTLEEPISVVLEYDVGDLLPELQMTVTVQKDAFDVFVAFDNDDLPEIVPTAPGCYRSSYTIPPFTLKEGHYRVRVTAGLPTELLQDIDEGLGFEVVASTENLTKKSYRADRAGLIVSPGHWVRSTPKEKVAND